MPGYDAGEEVKFAVAFIVVGEVGDWGVAARTNLSMEHKGERSNLRPGEDRDESDADDEGVLDAKSHEEGSDDATAENTDPELRALACPKTARREMKVP